jgi:caa(3)-type oxidase subunit IV
MSLPSGRGLIWTFVVLVALAVASWVAASAGTGTGLALAIAGAKALAIGLMFMELISAHPVHRVIAVVAVLFVVLLCAGMVTDVLYR